jgi:hypothetical protein
MSAVGLILGGLAFAFALHAFSEGMARDLAKALGGATLVLGVAALLVEAEPLLAAFVAMIIALALFAVVAHLVAPTTETRGSGRAHA